MQKQERFDIFLEELESKKHDIQHSDFRFYNVAHFPLIFKRSIECSAQCSTCNENIQVLESMIKQLPNALNSIKTRKEFEKQKTSIEKHLRKSHNFHFPGYYAALGALIAFTACIVLVIAANYLTSLDIPNKLIIFTLGISILTGWFAGNARDRKFFKRNLQL